MAELLKMAALILGLGISAHTVFAIARNYIRDRREARALAEQLRLEFEILVELISILRGKANRFNEKYRLTTGGPNDYQLSDQAKLDLEILKTRATRIVEAEPEIDLPKVCASLKRRQMNVLVEFLGAFQLYRQRLATRLEEFKSAPAQPGVLGRFIACCALDESLSEKLSRVREKLGVKGARANAAKGESD